MAAAEGGIVDSLSHPLNFPPFSVDWVDGQRIVVTGGGGASRTGVPNGVTIYLVREGIARLVDLRHKSTGQELPHFARACPQRDLLAVALANRLELWRLHDLTPMLAAPVITVPAGAALDPVMVVAFSPCGNYMAAAAHDGRVRLLKLETQMEAGGNPGEQRLTGLRVVAQCETEAEAAADKPYRDLAFHPGGRTLVGSCEDGSWRGWEIVEEAGTVPPAAPPMLPMAPRPPTAAILGLHPLFTLPATTGLAPAHAGKPESQAREQAVAAAVAKDQQAGVFYTCRCGRFTPDGSAFFSVHYARRGPKNTDKRPYLTKWALSLAPAGAPPAAGGCGTGGSAPGNQALAPALQGMTPVSCAPVGQDPLMCLALHSDGRTGAAGDCSGRTVHFRTADAKVVQVKEGMHNFGVTSLAFSPPPQGAGIVGGVHPVRLASSSGDKTIRLQYLEPPAHLVAAARARAAGAPQHRKRGVIRWALGTAFSLAWYAALAALVLGLWFALCCHLYGVPADRALDRVASGAYEGAAALTPYVDMARPYLEQAQAVAGQAREQAEPLLELVRPHWEAARPMVDAGWVCVKGHVDRGLERLWPVWDAHWPVVRDKLEGWLADWSQGEL